MTRVQETATRPMTILHWLYEEALIIEASGIQEEDLSRDQDMTRIARQLVREYRTSDRLAREIERDLDSLVTTISARLPAGRVRQASRELREQDKRDEPHIPHHPTTETLLHLLLRQEGGRQDGQGWITESRARYLTPDMTLAVRAAAREYTPSEHLVEMVDRELESLAHQALDLLEKARTPDLWDPSLWPPGTLWARAWER